MNLEALMEMPHLAQVATVYVGLKMQMRAAAFARMMSVISFLDDLLRLGTRIEEGRSRSEH